MLLALIDEPGNVISPENTVRLTDEQARGILELRLARLTGLEREKIQADLTEVADEIRALLEILGSQIRRMEVMTEELVAARKAIVSPRMTDIADVLSDQDDESLIEPGQMVVTITRDGFIKRTTLETYRSQNRGGRGRSGASTRGDDIVTRSFNAHTHQWVLFFSSGGKAYREKVWRLPEAGPTAKGRALVNLLPELGSDTITTVLPLPQDETLWESLHLIFATSSGNVRRNRLSDFRNVRAAGLIAMKLDEGDHLIGVATCREGDDVLLATRAGPLHSVPIDRRHGARFRRPRQFRGAWHQIAEPGRGHEPVRVAPYRRQPSESARRTSSWPTPAAAAKPRTNRNRAVSADAEEIDGEAI